MKVRSGQGFDSAVKAECVCGVRLCGHTCVCVCVCVCMCGICVCVPRICVLEGVFDVWVCASYYIRSQSVQWTGLAQNTRAHPSEATTEDEHGLVCLPSGTHKGRTQTMGLPALKADDTPRLRAQLGGHSPAECLKTDGGAVSATMLSGG